MTTYYVAQTAAGTEDGSSYANRMSVASHNADTFNAGDVIYLCDTISSQVVIPSSGSTGDGNRITYRGDYASHAAIMTANTSGGSLRATYKDYLIIDGLEIKDGILGIGMINNIDYVTIKNCTIHDMISKGILISEDQDPDQRNSNIIIGGASGDGNEIYNCGIDTGGVDVILSMSDAVIISHNKCYGGNTDTGIEGIHALGCDDVVIEYNDVYDHIKSDTSPSTDRGEDGINSKWSTNIIIRYNHVHNNRVAGIAAVDQYGDASSNVWIYGNYVHDHRVGINIPDLENNIYIYNNLIVNTTLGHGISSTAVGSNFYFYGNTIINCHGDGTDYGIFISGGSNYIIKNNIIYSDTHNDMIYRGTCTNATFDNNRYYYTGGAARYYWDGTFYSLAGLQGLSPAQETNGSEGNPQFTNVGSDIYTLLSSSPCINEGVNLGSSYDDALDPDNTDFTASPPVVATVLQGDHGTGWEMGAYAYLGHVPYDRFRGIKTSKQFNSIGRFR